MPGKRVSMRKIREVLRLKHDLGLAERQIAESCRVGKGTVGNYLRRAAAGLRWPLPPGLDDVALEALLYKREDQAGARREHPLPDWSQVYTELKRKGVTLALLWQEYHGRHPDGYGYTQFTVLYRRWLGASGVAMRQTHKAGEKLFVDYAGVTVPVTDPSTGEVRQARVFVAVLGASNYTYAELTETQGLEDWLCSHRRALEYFGGAPQAVVPDNLRAGVKSPCYYEPEINPAYAELAAHYGLAVIPARVRRPRDKAKVEVGVQVVERQVLAPLRGRTFFSLAEANAAVRELIERLNNRPFQKLPGSRRSVFEEVERPALRPLPAEPYVPSRWKRAKVNIDYHVEVDGHYYSVPYRYARETVDLRLTRHTVEVFLHDRRIAAHHRLPDTPHHRGKHTTVPEHMPEPHRRQGEWTPQRLVNWAQTIGDHTALVVEQILASRPHPEQGYRSCLGVMRLAKAFGPERLEAACRRACRFRAYSFKSVQSILRNGLDAEPLPEDQAVQAVPILHPNVRGPGYYGRG